MVVKTESRTTSKRSDAFEEFKAFRCDTTLISVNFMLAGDLNSLRFFMKLLKGQEYV